MCSLLRRRALMIGTFTPANLGETVLKWYNLKDSSNYVDNGSTISIRDLSPQQSHVTATTAKTVDSTGFLSGEGSLSEYVDMVANATMHRKGDFEVYINTKVPSLFFAIYVISTTTTAKEYYRFSVHVTRGVDLTVWLEANANSDLISANTGLTEGQNINVGLWHDGTDWRLNVNGSENTNWQSDPDYEDAKAITVDQYGHIDESHLGLLRTSQGDTYYDWGFRELIVTKPLTDAQRTNIINYLNN